MSYFPSISATINQNTTTDVGNSVVTSGSSFVGSVQSAFNINSIIILAKSTKDFTVYLDQGSANDFFEITDSFILYGNTGDSRVFASMAPYYRIRAYQTGAITSSSISCAVGQVPIQQVIPRKLSEQGGMRTTIDQYVVADLLNSSNVNLTANGTYTGTSASTLGIVGIQVSLKTDKNCIVYIDQSPDGVNWDIIDSFNYYYTLGGNGWTTQAINSYYRVRVTNSDSTSTTYFRLQSALCPIVEAVPRTLSQKGNLKTDVQYLYGVINEPVDISPMNTMRVTENHRLVGATFYGTAVDNNFWLTAVTANAVVNQNGGQLTLSANSTASAGACSITSIRAARYIGGLNNYFRGIIRLTPTTGVCNRYWGAYDPFGNSGFYFGHDGTNLSVNWKNTGVITSVSSGAFNGADYGSLYTVDNDAHSYQIIYTNRNAYFVIDNSIIHKATGSIWPLSDTLSLRCGAQIINGLTNANNNTLNVRSMSIHRQGDIVQQTQYKHISTTQGQILKLSSGRLHKILINDISSANSISAYDNSTTGISSTLIGVISIVSKTVNPFTQEFDLPFFTGLAVQQTAAQSITIVYE